MSMYKFIDLFCGIGGFRVALEQQGMECVFSSEIDPYAQDAYEANFGERPSGDITTIRNDDIPAHDILCAGFPCQSFSRSGNMKGFQDDRGRLFYEIVRIARKHKPSLLLLENVKTILTLDNGKVLSEIEGRLNSVGYDVQHSLLNASEFGIPQKRERVYFACVRRHAPMRYVKPAATFRQRYLKDVLMPNSKCPELIIDRDDIQITRDAVQPQLAPIRIGYLNKGGQGERIYSPEGHAITLSANGGGVGARTGLYWVEGQARRLHQDEAKKIMGFSARHKISAGWQGYKQLGNAVIPIMITQVYDAVRAC